MSLPLLKKNRKAQSSLESIALIGGTILVAVIVIVSVISLGGSSQKKVTDQSEYIGSSGALLSPNIISVTAKYEDCINSPHNAVLQFSWKPISVAGSFRLIIKDSNDNPVGNLDYIVSHDSKLLDMNKLDPSILNNILVSEINLGNANCLDTYYLYIEASKNNQIQLSRKYPFSWDGTGQKTDIVYRPSFNPPAGSYNVSNFPLSVQLTVPDASNLIYYTTDGSIPTTSSNIYDGSSISVNSGDTIKAISYKNNLSSAVSTATYTSSFYTLSNIIANPPSQSNILDTSIDVTLSTSDNEPDTTIYYTLDGSTPDCSGSFDSTQPITISSDVTLNAIACKTNYISSENSFEYSFFKDVGELIFNPSGNSYTSVQYVTITSTNSDVNIHYTTNGSNPTLLSPIYNQPIIISSDTTLKALASIGSITGSVYTEIYNITLPALAPVFTPGSGTYAVDQSILMSSTTPLPYTIRYTTDGSDPTPSSLEYTGSAIPITKNTILKAKTYKSGWSESPTTTANYNFALAVPSFDPVPGAYSDAQIIQINSAAGSQIRYTLDGSNPTLIHGTLINAGEFTIPITSTSSLKAITFKSGWSESSIASGVYTINDPAETPTFNPNGGSYVNSVSVSLSCSTPNSTIRYTTDGSTPSRDYGTIYTGAFTLTNTTTVSAVCYATGYSTSPVKTQTYNINLVALAPTITPNGGDFTSNTSALISTSTPLPYTIRYTTDGSDPTPSSLAYTGSAIPITKNTTLKAKTYKSGYAESSTTTAIFNFSYLAPTFDPTPPSNHADSVSVTINAPAGAIIRYTLDGSDPTQTAGTQILAGESTTPIISTSTLKAIAYRPSWNSSPIASGVYTINAPAATPTFIPDGGSHNGSVSVSLSCSTPNSTIRYTTDSSTPSRDYGTIYTGAFTLTDTTTVNAVCYATGYSTSPVKTKTFTINIIPDPVTVEGSGSYCNSATLTASGGAGGNIYYQGTTSNGTSTANQTNTQVVTSTGTYYFRSKSSADVWGPQGSASVIINYNPTSPTLISGNTSVCSGESTTLTVSGGNGTGYQWYANGCGLGNVLSTSSSLTINPSGNTIYYVRSTNSCGVSSCISKEVTVTSPPVVNVTPASNCGFGSVTLSATTSEGVIEWYDSAVGGSLLKTGTSYTTPNLSSTTTYYVDVSGASCDLSSRVPVSATINPIPSAVTVTSSPYGDCGEGYQLNTSGGSGGTIYYQGTTSNGTSTASTTSPIINMSGTYYFRSRSDAGCWGPEGSVTITYTPPEIVFEQTSFSNLSGWTANTTNNLTYSEGCLRLSPWYSNDIVFYKSDSQYISLNDVLIEAQVNRAELASGKPGILFNVSNLSTYNGVLISDDWDDIFVDITKDTSILESYFVSPYTTKYNIKIRSNGALKKIKVWAVGSSEPLNWDIDFSNSSYSSGSFGGIVSGIGGPCAIKVTKCS